MVIRCSSGAVTSSYAHSVVFCRCAFAIRRGRHRTPDGWIWGTRVVRHGGRRLDGDRGTRAHEWSVGAEGGLNGDRRQRWSNARAELCGQWLLWYTLFRPPRTRVTSIFDTAGLSSSGGLPCTCKNFCATTQVVR